MSVGGEKKNARNIPENGPMRWFIAWNKVKWEKRREKGRRDETETMIARCHGNDRGLHRSIERLKMLGLQRFYGLQRQSGPINKSRVVNQNGEKRGKFEGPHDAHRHTHTQRERAALCLWVFLVEQFSGGVFQHKKQQVGGAVFNWNKKKTVEHARLNNQPNGH